jgi:hypothetical protein
VGSSKFIRLALRDRYKRYPSDRDDRGITTRVSVEGYWRLV